MQQKFFSSHYPFAFHNKNLAEKLSDFDEILTSKSTQMVFSVVKFLSKSDNFLARFLNYLKGPSVEYLISVFFEHTQSYVNQKPRRLSWALTLRLGPTVGGTVFYVCIELRKGLCLKAPIENLVEVTRRTLDTMRLKFFPCFRVILIRSRA